MQETEPELQLVSVCFTNFSSSALGEEVQSFLNGLGHFSLYQSPKFLEFLCLVLPKARFGYIIARERRGISGLIAFSVMEHGQFGKAMNSLPFYGSHGGPISYSRTVTQSLLKALINLSEECQSRYFNLIEDPGMRIDDEVLRSVGLVARDLRSSHVTQLPIDLNELHPKTRAAVSKGAKVRAVISDESDDASWIWLQRVHESSITLKGGAPKSLEMFLQLKSVLKGDVFLRVARVHGEPVAGLVLIRQGDCVEYFTPVVIDQFRQTQILSYLIFDSMQQASTSGIKRWNWGGTRPDQESLKRFKERWRASTGEYRYFCRTKDLENEPNVSLGLSKYPHFYLGLVPTSLDT